MAVTADPMVSPDELVIVYLGAPDPMTEGDLFYATRASTSEPFGSAQVIPDVNSTALEGDPHVSDDGCELFFGSDRSGNRDLYLATAR